MNFMDRLKLMFSSKESQARIVTSMQQVGKPQHTPANYEGFARQGYGRNVTVYTAIDKVATACKGINWVLYSKKGRGKLTEIEDSPLLTLWDKPNPMQDQSAFIEAVVAFKMLTGNSYIEANTPFKNKPPLELWPVRPDKMKIIPGLKGYPAKYQMSYAGQERTWDVDPITLRSAIMHWKSFNPLNDWYGQSPLEAAMLALDQNNAGQKWNLSMLQHSASPSGVLQMKVTDTNPRGELTEEQYKRIKAEFEEGYQGSRNAGKPLLLEGGLHWQQISLSPKDMEFLKGKEVSATDLCLIFGVPPEMMGLGQKTFANYKEARLSFYEETVLPTMDSLRNSVNNWLTPAFGENLWLDYDRDDIEALVEKREARYISLSGVSFLTQNEKRSQVGFEEEKGLDVYVIGAQILSAKELEEWDEEEPSNSPQNPQPKPAENPDDVEETEDEEPDPEDEDDDGKGWKSINLLNAREKRQAWRRQERRKRRLASHFTRELQDDFQDMLQSLVKVANDLKDRDAKTIEFALLQTVQKHMPAVQKTLGRNIRFTLEDFGNMVLNEGKALGYNKENKANRKFDSFITEYIARHTGQQISTIENTTQKNIRNIVKGWTAETITAGDSLPQLTEMLEAEFEGLSKTNARRIARTEVALASNNGSLEAVKSLQIPNMFKEWVTASDGRVRDGEGGYADHSVMNGAEVALEEKFGVPPDSLMEGPGDPGAPADQVINCRCVLVYKSKN